MKRKRILAPDLMDIIDHGEQEDERQAQEDEDNRREREEERRRRQRQRQNDNERASMKKSKKKRKHSLKRAKKRMISKTKYKELIKQRQHNKKLTLNQRKYRLAYCFEK